MSRKMVNDTMKHIRKKSMKNIWGHLKKGGDISVLTKDRYRVHACIWRPILVGGEITEIQFFDPIDPSEIYVYHSYPVDEAIRMIEQYEPAEISLLSSPYQVFDKSALPTVQVMDAIQSILHNRTKLHDVSVECIEPVTLFFAHHNIGKQYIGNFRFYFEKGVKEQLRDYYSIMSKHPPSELGLSLAIPLSLGHIRFDKIFDLYSSQQAMLEWAERDGWVKRVLFDRGVYYYFTPELRGGRP